jgi:hypothetical protein
VIDAGDFVLPSHCLACGVPLAGGATRHRENCAILELIRENVPGYNPPMLPGVTRAPEARCIECGSRMNAIGTADGSDVAPIPNESLTVCLKCGAVHMIGNGLKIRELTLAERARLSHDVEQMRELRKMQRAVHFARAALN